MKGTRETWAGLLPLLQAFANGEPVQSLDFGGRWVDTDEVYGVLGSSASKFRIKPHKSRMGIWKREFTLTEPGAVNGPLGSGTFIWEGADTDTPFWNSRSGLTYTSEAEFTPHKAAT
jgi:hypothetical protein